MNSIYIAGRNITVEGKPVFQVALALAGKVYVSNKPEDISPADALTQTFSAIASFFREHPEKLDKSLSVYQTLIPERDAFYGACANNEPLSQAKEQIRDLFQERSKVTFDWFILDDADKRLFDRIDGKAPAYRFKEDDIIIAHRKTGEDETPEQAAGNDAEFAICARVLEVDRQNDTLLLDKYMKRGEVDVKNYPQSLLEAELLGKYEPMNALDVLMFHEGLETLAKCSPKSRKLNDRETTLETLDVVAELEAELSAEELAKPEKGKRQSKKGEDIDR